MRAVKEEDKDERQAPMWWKQVISGPADQEVWSLEHVRHSTVCQVGAVNIHNIWPREFLKWKPKTHVQIRHLRKGGATTKVSVNFLIYKTKYKMYSARLF